MSFRRTAKAIPVIAALISAVPAVADAQLRRPDSWRVRTDTPVPDSAVYLVGMPPGWHVTTGPGSVLYDPAYQGRGRYALDAEIFLFPGKTNDGYGVFIGGSGLDGASPAWVAFLLTREGGATIERRSGETTTTLFATGPTKAVKPHPGGNETAFNTLRVAVERDSVVFSANHERIAAIPRGDLEVEGTFGFRIGKDVNIHASNLDLVTRLAPTPVRR